MTFLAAAVKIHPLNAGLRFLLEVAALVTFAIWGARVAEGWAGVFWAILFPLVFAALWGIFAVRDDPSRSGKTVVNTPGWIRLILELFLFGAAVWMLYRLDHRTFGLVLGALLILHYALSYKRIGWLLQKP